MIAVKPYPLAKSMLICPAGPVTSNIPASPAKAPDIPMHKTTRLAGFTP